MGTNQWRFVESGGYDDQDLYQCMMCKEYLHGDALNFCPSCGTQWEGQMECSEKGRKWHDIVAKYGRSMDDNRVGLYSLPKWKVKSRCKINDSAKPTKWEDFYCYDRKDAVKIYKKEIERQKNISLLTEVVIVRVMEDGFLKYVIRSGWIGRINEPNNVSEVLSKRT